MVFFVLLSMLFVVWFMFVCFCGLLQGVVLSFLTRSSGVGMAFTVSLVGDFPKVLIILWQNTF